MSFRSSSADLDFIVPPAMETSITSKRASRRARKKIKDISNTLKIQDNTSKVAERSNSPAALHGSQDGLTNTGASNYPCNTWESIYPKYPINSVIANESLSTILHLHFILYGPPNLEVLRNDILTFIGFPFCKDSGVWKQKVNFLKKLRKKDLKHFLTFLCIPYSTKEKSTELFNKLLVGLEAYTIPGKSSQ
ncbi:hypothetical protein TNCT_93532 [Trichonephila clavata]|uniref:Uncharacterized protein n=1 Tax=Trichonephila clavata TaxID=2740835 RepID=A0A8X6H727_TRICU|nr:hypothetical protein TNCT_93532 [Trichonephila clavata]